MFGPFSRQVGDGNNAPETQLSWLLAYICQRAADSFGSETDMWKGQVRLQSRGGGIGDKKQRPDYFLILHESANIAVR